MSRGTALALVHGWAFGPSVWNGLLDDLGADVPATCWRLPGYGGGPICPTFDPDTGIAWAGPPVAVGWSLGGMLLTATAARAPGALRALVLVGVNARFLADASWPDAVDAAELDGLVAGLHDDRAATLRRFAALCARGESARQTLRALLHCLDTEQPPSTEVLLEGLAQLQTMDLREALAALPIPVRLIVGDADPLLPIAATAAMQRLNRRLEVCIIPGAGHAPFLSHPAAFRCALEPLTA